MTRAEAHLLAISCAIERDLTRQYLVARLGQSAAATALIPHALHLLAPAVIADQRIAATGKRLASLVFGG